MGRLQQMEMRRQRKSKDVGRVRERARATAKAGKDPTLANFPSSRVSVSHGTEAKYKKQVEQFLSFADQERLALVADDEVDAAIVLYLNMSYSQGRPVSDGEVLLAGLLFFQPQYGKLGGQKLARSEGLEKKGSDTIKTTVAKNDLLWSLLGNGEKQETSDGHPCPDDGCDVLPSGELLQSVREDLIRQCMVWQAIGHCSSTQFNEACRAKHKATTTQLT